MPVVAIRTSSVVGRSLFAFAALTNCRSARSARDNKCLSQAPLGLTCLCRVPILSFRGRALDASWSTTLPLTPENLTVATTGASGSVFLKHFLLTVERDPRVKTVNFIASDGGLRVMAEELGVEGRSDLLRQIVGAPSAKIQQQSNTDIGANVASGSYPSDAMVVIPCSVGTLGRIANGTDSRLIERAADVTLKERRPLVLCIRETP